MRYLLLLLVVSCISAAEYAVEREVTIRLDDGRTLTGIMEPDGATLLMLLPSGSVSRFALHGARIMATEPSSAATAAVEDRRRRAEIEKREREAEADAARQRQRDAIAARLRADEEQRQADKERRRIALATADRYAAMGMRFDPDAMSVEQMDAEANRILEERAAADAAKWRDELRRQREAEEAERAAADQRRRIQERERRIDEATRKAREADAQQAAIDEAAQRVREQKAANERAFAMTLPFKLVFGVLLIAAVVAVLLLPAVVALHRRHPHRVPIVIVNVFSELFALLTFVVGPPIVPFVIGVDGLVWIGCLAWACWPLPKQTPTVDPTLKAPHD